jgi:hypothetical protein
MTARTILIDPRFNGPPASGNGGFVAGTLAEAMGAASAEVSLRAPPPLGKPLQLQPGARGLSLLDGDLVLAQVEPAEFDLEVPTVPSIDAAAVAGTLGRWQARSRRMALWPGGNPYDHCFGCGIARTDGLQLIPSPVDDTSIVATTWVASANAATATGELPAAITWAALDCPAGIAWHYQIPDSPPMMTARITARVDRPLRAGERYRVLGWPIRRDGRKLHAGSAIVDDDGQIRARSLQLWLLPRA